MLTRLSAVLLCLFSLSLFSGCSIVKTVNPVESGIVIDKIYVEKNPNVHMEGLHPEVVLQLKGLGFAVETYEALPPEEAIYTFVYTANWNWDMAMYLTYFQGTLMENGRVLGRAEYDSRRGGANMGKFGKTAEKIRPLLMDLMSNVTRTKPSTATSVGSH